jgi:hypothetical protein
MFRFRTAAVLLLLFLCPLMAQAQGQTVFFGHGSDGAPLSFRVMTESGEAVLLLSEEGLQNVPYHDVKKKDVTWESCSLRTYLNGEFLSAAFSPEEQASILLVELSNPETYGTPGGNATQDRVFLLSREELYSLMPTRVERIARASAAAALLGGFVSARGQCLYWLRSPGVDAQHAMAVSITGLAESHSVLAQDICIRPALWVRREALGL